jgi:hypothetical protein
VLCGRWLCAAWPARPDLSMTELKADFAIFKEPGFLLAPVLACSVLAWISAVICYVQM